MGTHKPRGYSVNDFISWSQKKELVLQPKFQRRDVWSNKAKSHLIDTILRGLPIPIIFMRQDIDPRQRRTIREVVDGQQRLTSIISYCNDEFPVLKSQNESFGGSVFSKLPTEAQQQFLSYEFSVVILEGATDADVLDIFARLNTYAQKLTSQELLNAKYFGEFKQVIYSLGHEHLEFWRKEGILRNIQIVRMAEAELTTELVVTMLAGIQHRRNKINELYESKDDDFPEKKKVQKEFKSIIDTIALCFGDELKNSIYSRRALFHSLFCAFYHLKYGIPKTKELGDGGAKRHLSHGDLFAIKESLFDLQTLYRRKQPPDHLLKFIEACRKGTADRDQRVIRTKKIYDLMQKAVL